MAEDMAHSSLEVTACHPRTVEDINESLAAWPDLVVVGDFRYYAYFANPRPQVQTALQSLRDCGWDGPTIVAGRHARFMKRLGDEATCVAGSYRELVRLLPGFADSDPSLGADGDALPGPGLPAMDVLADAADLPGSYSRPGSRMAQLVLSKGCPYECAFCEKAGLAVTTMTEIELRTALERFTAAGTDRLIFWDEVFAWPHQEHHRHLATLAEFGIGFNCNARFDSLRPGFVAALAEAGCKEVLFGLEVLGEQDHGRHDLLNLDRGKRRDLAFIRDRISLLADHGIAAVGSLIIGLPGDTPATISARISAADALGLSHCYVRPLVPFPESALYDELVSEGAVPSFEDWPVDELDSFPHGYPTLHGPDRAALAAFCGR
jgi:hypothetical protein